MLRIVTSTLYRQTTDSIQQRQAEQLRLQSQMSSGLRVQTAADDPAASSRILGFDARLAEVSRWQSNAIALQNRLGLEDGALSGVNGALTQLRSLALQANNGSLIDSDRQAIATSMRQQLQTILAQANTQDSNGRYLFGGTQDGAAPLALTASGTVYSGNSDVSLLALGPTRELAAGDAGDAVFMHLKTGDGQVAVGAARGNSGSAYVSDAHLADGSQWDGGSYTVRFEAGQYQVLDASQAVVASGAYRDGEAVQFRGLSLSFQGAPAQGDSFSIGPSGAQDLFATVQNLIDLVATPGQTAAQKAQNQTALYGALQSLGTAQTHIGKVLAGVGARERTLDDARTQLDASAAQLQKTLSGLQDTDYAAATAQLGQSKLALQAAEQSYTSIQGLSLFNYIR
jgi:flagellar hook-associated protein 3 FlgL